MVNCDHWKWIKKTWKTHISNIIIPILSEQSIFHKLYNKVFDVSVLSTDFFFFFFHFTTQPSILIKRYKSVREKKLFLKLYSWHFCSNNFKAPGRDWQSKIHNKNMYNVSQSLPILLYVQLLNTDFFYFIYAWTVQFKWTQSN